MNDAQHPLDLLAHDVVSPVPPGLLDTARAARRRRVRGRLAVGGAVAAVAVVALAVTLPGGGGGSPRPQAPVAAPTSTGPVAPTGTTWVSQDGYMVAVPGEWTRTRTNCVGAVQDEGPGFYYLEIDANYCLSTEDEPPSVGLLRGGRVPPGSTPLDCAASCSQTVVEGPVVLRLREIGSAEDVAAIVDTLQPVPDSWVVDPVTGVAWPATATADTTPVTDRADVVGEWLVVRVPSGAVPLRAERRLSILAPGRDAKSLVLQFPVDCNTTMRAVRLGPGGSLRGGGSALTTMVGCGSSGAPSGFGVLGAKQLRLTPTGDLVLVGADGTALAVYERA